RGRSPTKHRVFPPRDRLITCRMHHFAVVHQSAIRSPATRCTSATDPVTASRSQRLAMLATPSHNGGSCMSKAPKPPLTLRLQVLAAVDYAPGATIRERIK